MLLRASLAAILVLAPALALAGPPRVVADIAPLHSLVARVMEGIAEPGRLLAPGVSPHGHALRPSEAAMLAEAEVVFWIGPELTPWLERNLSALAADALVIPLLSAEGTHLIEFGDRPGEPGHDEPIADGDAHGHDDVDPHAWLDPRNGQLWLGQIAAALARVDPENAAAYRANAARGQAEIEALVGDIDRRLAPVRGRRYVVFHDGYRYFEERFGIAATAAVALGDAAPPGPARIAEIRARLGPERVRCLFTEPQLAPVLGDTVIEGTDVRIATLDPIGAGLPAGPGLYAALLRDMADALATCLE